MLLVRPSLHSGMKWERNEEGLVLDLVLLTV